MLPQGRNSMFVPTVAINGVKRGQSSLFVRFLVSLMGCIHEMDAWAFQVCQILT